MLLSSFQHFEAIGEKRERQLWQRGVVSWDDLESSLNSQLPFFGPKLRHRCYRSMAESRSAIRDRDSHFFAARLPKREHYRIALAFRPETLFLDIETTGLSRYYDEITLIGWSLNSHYGVFIKGGDDEQLRNVISRSKALVTFNGSLFDLPFIRQEFPDLPLPAAHVDLRFFGRRVGLHGSQKEIERQLALKREGDIAELDGRAAPILWHHYCRGDKGALERLILYNHADIEGMKYIIDFAIGRLLEIHDIPDSLWPEKQFANSSDSVRCLAPRNLSGLNLSAIPRFAGRRGPRLSLRDLDEAIPTSRMRVVGIDLSGSERRASGWCCLSGDQAASQRLKTDEELIKTTLDSKPDLVSIDSPLSLPKGRKRASDDDPTREAAGITRTCERLLRSRGIGVYPCLIPSMQDLTERGIRLADTLRKYGIPVIESYPGAAQDILGIPRKRASLELLKRGLEDFGLSGAWTTEKTTHDELDAITSALVGYFFWAGRFEALGDEEEGSLIVPDLRVNPTTWLRREVVGISGPIAAGKTTVARFLEKRGYVYGRFSKILEEIIRSQGKEPTRDALQQLGNKVSSKPGQRWLCKQLVHQLGEAYKIVIDGLRHPEDHSYLVEFYGPAFQHLHIDTPRKIRRIRYQQLGYDGGHFDLASRHSVEASVPKLSQLSHHRLTNTKSIGELEPRVQRTLKRLRRKTA